MSTDEDLSSSSDEEEEDYFSSSFEPIHFRECLRLLDQSLQSFNSAIVPPWFSHQTIPEFPDPQFIFHRTSKFRRIYSMKTDFLDKIPMRPNAFEISLENFSISNRNFSKQIRTFIEPLQIHADDVDFQLEKLIQLKPFAYPRQFPFEKTDRSIAKLFIFLPSKSSSSTKQILRFQNEIHSFELPSTFSYTLIPTSDECSLTIENLSRQQRLILIYNIYPLKSNIYFNLHLPEQLVNRVKKSLDICLESSFKKIIIPFLNPNLLLYRYGRLIGSILMQTTFDDFLLYQGLIQPNRSNDNTRHICRLITQMNFLSENSSIDLFKQIDSCLANCNESYYSSNQLIVPVFCLIPKREQFDLFIDNLPLIFDYLEQNPHIELINWLINQSIRPPKKLLHLILFNNDLLKFFSPIQYEDLMKLYPISSFNLFQEIFQSTENIHDMIKFLGVLSTTDKIHSNQMLVLIHLCLIEVFRRQPTLIDLTNLLTLLSSIDVYNSSCQCLVEEIIRRTTTVNDFLRAILIPNLIQMQKKRKTYPSWFYSLHKHCRILLENNHYQPTLPAIQLLNENCCQLCRILNRFFRDTITYEKLFFIRKNQIEHFERILKDHLNLTFEVDSITSDEKYYRIYLTKLSIADQEIYRENQILKTILDQFHFHQQSDRHPKRFKTFFV